MKNSWKFPYVNIVENYGIMNMSHEKYDLDSQRKYSSKS